MKRIVFLVVFILVMSGISASSDWIDGYLQGYSDAKAGLPNIIDELATEKQVFPNWDIYYYIDEFGDQTEQRFVAQKEPMHGTYKFRSFEAEVIWTLVVDSREASIAVYEYEEFPVSGTGYILKIKDTKGNISTFLLNDGIERLYFSDTDFPRLIHILKSGETIKLLMSKEDSSYSYNLGSLDTNGFSVLYDSIVTKRKLQK